MGTLIFDDKLYSKAKNELKKFDSKKAIKKYKLIKTEYLDACLHPEYLPRYAPILTVINQFEKSLKNKKILEIGFRVPLFINFLETKNANIYGIDSDPYVINNKLLKMSVDKFDPKFIKEHKGSFNIIYQKLCLSRLYDEMFYSEHKKSRFRNKTKILKTISKLLKPQGLLILLDDRGTIFTLSDFKKAKLTKALRELPIVYYNSKKQYDGWNILSAYRKE